MTYNDPWLLHDDILPLKKNVCLILSETTWSLFLFLYSWRSSTLFFSLFLWFHLEDEGGGNSLLTSWPFSHSWPHCCLRLLSCVGWHAVLGVPVVSPLPFPSLYLSLCSQVSIPLAATGSLRRVFGHQSLGYLLPLWCRRVRSVCEDFLSEPLENARLHQRIVAACSISSVSLITSFKKELYIQGERWYFKVQGPGQKMSFKAKIL